MLILGRLVRVGLVLLLFFPLVHLVGTSISAADVTALRGGLDLPRLLALFGRSVGLAVAAATVAATLGTCVALAAAGRRSRWRHAFFAISMTPLLLPPVFQVAVWENLTAADGFLHRVFLWLASGFGDSISERDSPLSIRNAPFAVWILGLSYAPIVLFFATFALARVPRELVTAARVHRGRASVFVRIVLPLALPAILAGSGVAFTLCLLNYEVPRLLDLQTYAVLVNVRLESDDTPAAAVLFALPLLAVAAFFLLATQLWANRRGFAISGVEPERVEDERPASFAGTALILIWFVLSFAMPVSLLLSIAGEFSVWWDALATDWERILSSLFVGFFTAVGAVVLAVLCLPIDRHARSRFHFLLWLPFAVPGTLLGVAILNLRGDVPRFALAFFDSWGVLVVAGIWRFFPLAFFAMAAFQRRVPEAQWLAARVHCDRFHRWARVYIPVMAPGFLTGALSVALLSMQELSATILLAPPGVEPLIVRIYNLLHYDPERNVLAALCLDHIATVFILVVVLSILFGRRRSEADTKG